MCYGVYDGVVDCGGFGDHGRNRVHIRSQHVSIPGRGEQGQAERREEEKRGEEMRHVHVMREVLSVLCKINVERQQWEAQSHKHLNGKQFSVTAATFYLKTMKPSMASVDDTLTVNF